MGINTVLFDLGGVLSVDPMQTILFHERGICARLNIDPSLVERNLSWIWDKYSVLPYATAEDFWKELSSLINTSIDSALVDKVALDVLTIDPEAKSVFSELHNQQIQIGIISNNTAFFYPMQIRALDLDKFINSELVFLSHQAGMTKETGLFEIAVAKVVPANTLVVDDREGNIERAKMLGFHGLVYSMNSRASLKLTVRQAINQTRSEGQK